MRTILLLAAFALPILIALSAKYRNTGGPTVTVFRTLVGLIGFLLVAAGLGGLGVCVWLILQTTHGNGSGVFLLVAILGAASLFSMFLGKMLIGLLRGEATTNARQAISSSGWSALDRAVENRRIAGLAPHLRVDALRKSENEPAVFSVDR